MNANRKAAKKFIEGRENAIKAAKKKAEKTNQPQVAKY